MLKCNMIHSFPNEYREVYEKFQNGGTIRTWINLVELLGRKILERNPDILRREMQNKLPDTWTLNVDNEFVISGPPDQKCELMLRNVGATRHPSHWTLTTDQVAEFVGRDVLNKFKGDMLEVLSEIFFRQFEADEAIGIRDYVPVQLDSDYGVDAVGTDVNGHQVAVQVKYRSNPSDRISYADIARTFTSAVCQLKMNDVLVHDHTIFLLTTASDVTGAFNKVMGKKAVIVARPHIATKIDNNKTFWKQAFYMMTQSLT